MRFRDVQDCVVEQSMTLIELLAAATMAVVAAVFPYKSAFESLLFKTLATAATPVAGCTTVEVVAVAEAPYTSCATTSPSTTKLLDDQPWASKADIELIGLRT